MKRPVVAEGAPNPASPYSPAIDDGRYVFCSGQTGIDPKSGEMVVGTEAQTFRAIMNLKEVLRAAGLALADVVKVNVFMVDISEFSRMNDEYAKHFPRPFPARSTVQVAALPMGARVEIEAVATKSR